MLTYIGVAQIGITVLRVNIQNQCLRLEGASGGHLINLSAQAGPPKAGFP